MRKWVLGGRTHTGNGADQAPVCVRRPRDRTRGRRPRRTRQDERAPQAVQRLQRRQFGAYGTIASARVANRYVPCHGSGDGRTNRCFFSFLAAILAALVNATRSLAETPPPPRPGRRGSCACGTPRPTCRTRRAARAADLGRASPRTGVARRIGASRSRRATSRRPRGAASCAIARRRRRLANPTRRRRCVCSMGVCVGII